MTNRDLVFAAMANQPVKRVPIGFWFHFLPEAETGDFLENPSLLERSVLAHHSFIEVFKPDMVKIMSDGFFFYPGLRGLDSPEQLGDVAELKPGHPWLDAQVELVEKVRAADPGLPYFYNVFSPLTTLRFALGRARLLSFINDYPSHVAGALSRIGRGLGTLARAVIGPDKADGIYLSVQNPDRKTIADDVYVKRFSQSEVSVLEEANTANGRNILHICGYDGVRNNLSCFKKYPAEVFSWAVNVERVSLGLGRTIFGGRAVLGGFPNKPGTILMLGKKSDIERFARDAVMESGPQGLILGADCTVPSNIPLERLEWVRQALIEMA
jgi:uroporphyrinogen decarboxylase